MKKNLVVFSFLVGAVLAGVLYAAPGPAVRVYVSVPPPPALVEVRTSAPGPGYVWIAGYHRWDGGAYVWVPGRWALPPHRHGVWVPGRWKHAHHAWRWVEGRWR